jgi:long-chain acyl-CoA synthetase
MFGNRINLDEIEELILTEGHECACTGIDDSINIFITNPEEKNHIKSYISKKTRIHSSGFKIIDIDDIPRNETGKVLYSELDFQYLKKINV